MIVVYRFTVFYFLVVLYFIRIVYKFDAFWPYRRKVLNLCMLADRKETGLMIHTVATQESEQRGTFDFPLEYYFVDPSHPRYHMPFHWHIEYELVYVRDGMFTLRLADETIELNAGDGVLIPDGAIHGGTPKNGIYECVVFDFTRFLQESTIGKEALMKVVAETICSKHFFPSESESAAVVCKICDTLKAKRFGFELIVNGLIWQLMGSLVGECNSGKRHTTAKNYRRIDQIKKVLRKIRKDYATKLTLSDLAAEASIAPKYLCRVFREITGMTPIEYLNYYRIECAGELMRMSDAPMTDIAVACGYNDQSHFAKTFKKYKGISARDYRLLGQK